MPAELSTGADQVRIVVGEDSYLVREGVKQLLHEDRSIEIVGTGIDLESVAQAVVDHRPDVLVTDIRMPPTNTDEGLRLVRQLRSDSPEIGVVVLSQHDDPEYVLGLLEDGAAGRAYLLKQRLSDIGQLSQAIHQVAKGGSVVDPEIVDILMRARSSAHRSVLDSLTAREQEVLSYIAQGKSNAGIATRLATTERAVERHISSIFMKLDLFNEPDVHRRVQAAILYLSAPHQVS